MQGFGDTSTMPGDARIETRRLVIHLPSAADAPRVLAYFERNRTHLERWEPARPKGFYSQAFWEHRLEQNRIEFEEGRSLRFFIELRRPDRSVIGTCNFSNIVRGAFQACHLGYAICHTVEGRGVMSEALRVALPFAFDRLGLHRIMANYQPTNERSGRLLRRLGFVVEGYARDYLYINGEWRDHVLTSLVRGHGPR